jgi:hypothetical protein
MNSMMPGHWNMGAGPATVGVAINLERNATRREEETMRTTMQGLFVAIILACTGMPGTVAAALPANDVSELVASLLPSVVNISVVRYAPAVDADGKPLADGSKIRKPEFGSGYIVDSGGVVVTNRHVTDGADEIKVILNDGTELRASLVYRSPDLDLAMLRVHSMGELHAIRWGNSDLMREGMPVIAIGDPLGIGFTVTAGIVSARDRDIKETAVDSFIQIARRSRRGGARVVRPVRGGGECERLRRGAVGAARFATVSLGDERALGLGARDRGAPDGGLPHRRDLAHPGRQCEFGGGGSECGDRVPARAAGTGDRVEGGRARPLPFPGERAVRGDAPGLAHRRAVHDDGEPGVAAIVMRRVSTIARISAQPMPATQAGHPMWS